MSAVLLPATASLKITSPREKALVHPGDTVTVTVSATGSFAQLIIMGQDPIGSSQVLKTPPFQFSVQITSDITPGSYALTASGAISPGNGVESDPISIDVERTDQPTSITVEPSNLTLAVGERASLRVVGTYGDNSTLDLTESTQTTYLSQNASVVTVSTDGFVTGVSPGSTQILIDGNIAVPITVQPPILITPSQVTVAASQTRQFIARSSDDQSVTWSVAPDGAGTINSDGLYTAPPSITSQQIVTITATSSADNSQTAIATVTLTSSASIAVSPSWITLYPGQVQPFTATTSNIGTSGLLWSISPASAGSIDANGVYSAPTSIPSLRSATITATSASNPNISGSITAWLSPPPFTLFSYTSTSIAVPQAGSLTFGINLLTTHTFGHPVTLSVVGLPSGITTTFDQPLLVGSAQTNLSVSPSATVDPGSYTGTIIGTDVIYPALIASLPLTVTVQTQQGTRSP